MTALISLRNCHLRSSECSRIGTANARLSRGAVRVVPTLPIRTTTARPLCRAHSAAAASASSERESVSQGPATESVKFTFSLPYQCEFGQYISIVGGPQQLGDWNAANSARMEWREGDVWSITVDIDAKLALKGFEYKYVIQNEDGETISWCPGDNIRCKVPQGSALDARAVNVGDVWDNADQSVEVVKAEKTEAVPLQESSAEELRNFSRGVVSVASTQGVSPSTMVQWLQGFFGSVLSVASVFRVLRRRVELLRKSGRKDSSVPDNPIAGTVFKARRRVVATLQPNPESAHYLQDNHLSAAARQTPEQVSTSSAAQRHSSGSALSQYAKRGLPLPRSSDPLPQKYNTTGGLPATQAFSQWILQFFVGKLVRLH